MDADELKTIVDLHKKWLNGDSDGRRANLTRANLDGANLTRANLDGANLTRANLTDANLTRANLTDANLTRANLTDASLDGANLDGANLTRANLTDASLDGANLDGANLTDANLYGANLDGANLTDANLYGANNVPKNALATTVIVPDGDIIGWKVCKDNVIVKLLVPSDARRSNATGRKCRAEFVKVLEVIGAEVAIGSYDNKTEYRAGEIVKADSWDENRWSECSHGIHFFITRWEAEHYW